MGTAGHGLSLAVALLTAALSVACGGGGGGQAGEGPKIAQQAVESLEGPPAQAALSFIAALHGGDRAALLASMSPAMVTDFRGPQAEQTIPIMKQLFPANLAVTGVSLAGEGKAVVRLTVVYPEGFSAGATIETEIVEGEWKVTGAGGDFGPS